jgi:hypothetical protein
MISSKRFSTSMQTRISKIQIFLILVALSSISAAQDYDPGAETPYDLKRQGGLGFAMAESGSSLGLFMTWPLLPDFHFGIGFDAFLLRDSKQLDFYDYYYGIPYTINKQNNVYLFDLLLTAKRRLFRDELSDDFRPFLSLAVGPIYGMNYPETQVSSDSSSYKKKDEFAWAFGGYVGCGIDFSVKSNSLVSIRAQYRIIPFAEKIGERSNHSMFELRFEIAQRF